MDLVVTDNYRFLKDIAKGKSENIFLVTTKEAILLQAKRELNIDGKYVYDVVDNIKNDVVDIINSINKMLYDKFDEKERIIWEVAYSNGCECSIFLEQMLIILKNCFFLEGRCFSNIYLYCVKDNILVCKIMETIFPDDKNNIIVRYKNVFDEIYYKASKKTSIVSNVYFCLYKIYIFLKLFFSSIHIKKENKKYEFGQAMCSDEIRMINWLNELIEQMEGVIQYRILCLKCPKAYKFFKRKNIPTDFMEQWVCFKILIKKTLEFRRLSNIVKRKLKQDFNLSFQRVDVTDVIKEYLYYYNTFLMFKRYEDNIICASYFKSNRFNWIEPWCVSTYPETRVFFLNAGNETKYSRIYDTMVYKDELCYEKYPQIFTAAFFSPIGYDCIKIFEKNKWIKNKYYFNIQTTGLYKKWVQAESNEKERDTQIVILWAPSNPLRNVTTLESMIVKTNLVLDEILKRGYRGICKLHPNLSNLSVIKEELGARIKVDNICFVDNKADISSCIKEADVVITDISTVIFEGISYRKPVICFLNKQQYDIIDYMVDYINIYTDIELMFEHLHSVFEDINYFNQWRSEYIKKQNKIFECVNKIGVNPYYKIKEMIEKI